MRNYPEEFLKRMQELLRDEYPSFIETFEHNRYYGLRVNTLKLTPEEFKRKVPFHLTPIPWTKEGFYYEEQDEPGKHHYHNAGLYYIQEPSAMAPAAMLGTQPGEKILDLCAAPGGKTTQIAADLKGTGVVVANDISLKRAQTLAMNIQRLGIRNTFVTNESPEKMVEYFPAYFDRILVDAPCSGEGMFRKMPDAIGHWSQELINNCGLMQKTILEQAAQMLKPGGVLIYSTCTFAPEENEGTIQNFIEKHPEFDLIEMPVVGGFKPGRPDWVKNGINDLKKTIRLWPHNLSGEGHFVAKLKKNDGEEKAIPEYFSQVRKKELQHYLDFCKENLSITPEGKFTIFGSHLYLTPSQLPSFSDLRVIRPGWYLGEFKKNRFEPAHGFAMGLQVNQVYRTITLFEPDLISSYLRGETLHLKGEKGWTLIEVDKFPLGWGKMVDNILKNHYPRSMRWLF